MMENPDSDDPLSQVGLTPENILFLTPKLCIESLVNILHMMSIPMQKYAKSCNNQIFEQHTLIS